MQQGTKSILLEHDLAIKKATRLQQKAKVLQLETKHREKAFKASMIAKNPTGHHYGNPIGGKTATTAG